MVALVGVELRLNTGSLMIGSPTSGDKMALVSVYIRPYVV